MVHIIFGLACSLTCRITFEISVSPLFKIMKPTKDSNKSFYPQRDRAGALSSAPTVVGDWARARARARALSTSDYSLHYGHIKFCMLFVCVCKSPVQHGVWKVSLQSCPPPLSLGLHFHFFFFSSLLLLFYFVPFFSLPGGLFLLLSGRRQQWYFKLWTLNYAHAYRVRTYVRGDVTTPIDTPTVRKHTAALERSRCRWRGIMYWSGKVSS